MRNSVRRFCGAGPLRSSCPRSACPGRSRPRSAAPCGALGDDGVLDGERALHAESSMFAAGVPTLSVWPSMRSLVTRGLSSKKSLSCSMHLLVSRRLLERGLAELELDLAGDRDLVAAHLGLALRLLLGRLGLRLFLGRLGRRRGLRGRRRRRGRGGGGGGAGFAASPLPTLTEQAVRDGHAKRACRRARWRGSSCAT